MQGRVAYVGYEYSESGATRKIYAMIRVDFSWRKDIEDAELEIEKLNVELNGKEVIVTPL